MDELFDGLVKRFYLPTPEGLTPEELKEWTEKKLRVVRFRSVHMYIPRYLSASIPLAVLSTS